MPQPSIEGLSTKLARHVAGAQFAQLGVATRRAAGRAVLDAVGVMGAASGLAPEVQPFIDLALASQGRPEATLLGTGHRAPAPMAAFANGAMSHALDYEDAFDRAPVHPNASLVPSLLALAQARAPVSGKQFLTALAVGCDLTCRLGLGLRRDLAEGGWYPPPILGAMGAVAGCARLLGLSPSQVEDAWSLMLLQNSTPMQIRHGDDCLLRAVREAFPAQAAVTAAMLAEAGIRGFPGVFEGEAGFFRLFAQGQYDTRELLDGLGSHWYVDELSFKPWPSCRGTHAAIEAALALRAQPGFGLRDIEGIEVAGGPVQQMLAEPLPRKQSPATATDAKFSLPFTVATALCKGAVALEDFGAEALRDAAVLQVAARVSFHLHPGWGRAQATSGAVTLRLRDGTRVQHEVAEPAGSPQRPLDDERLTQKFVDCLGRASRPLPDPAARALAARLLALPAEPDVGALF